MVEILVLTFAVRLQLALKHLVLVATVWGQVGLRVSSTHSSV
ncbi:MAG: hypothetical protein OXM02_07670 [Bacteroidota bacterium]|nr:hypothetical protein [Bacteroidota bacterium]